MSGQNVQKLVSSRKGGSRRGSASSQAASNGKVEHETPRPHAEAPSAPPSLCACPRSLPADAALGIIRVLKQISLPGEVQVVHALNPTGMIINRLRELRVKLVDRAVLVSELALRQISDGDGNGHQIKCADVKALLGDLHSACTLAFGWWRSVTATAVALQQAAQLADGADDQLEAVLEQLKNLDPLMEELGGLVDALPEPRPNIEDLADMYLDREDLGSVILRILRPDAPAPQG